MLRSILLAAVASVTMAGPATADALSCPARAPVAISTSEVPAAGMVAAFIKPSAPGVYPGLLILGGSEGGTDVVRRLATPFAQQGYAVLALSYFGAAGLPASLEDIPLEYFHGAIEWLGDQPGVDRENLGIYGVSKGAEAALLLGSRTPQLRAIAAGMPTHAVWPGVAAMSTSSRSSWSSGGLPLANLPYDMSRPFDPGDWMGSVYRYYAGSIARSEAHPQALIAVERSNGLILLISGEDDRLWPATQMSDRVMERLKSHGFAFESHHLAYSDAGHAVGMPPAFGAWESGPDEAIGGTAAGNAQARADMWPKLICFFDKALERAD